MRPQKPRLSVVVPVFDEEACLPELHRRLAALDGLQLPRETIFVDDGSADGSFRVISALAAADPTVRGLRLAENCGSQGALLTGMRAARGDVVVTLDADLQHPPEKIPEMIAAWRAGHDIVDMLRAVAPSNGVARDLLTPAFYWAFNKVAPVRVDPASTDFRLVDRSCIDALDGTLLRAAAARLERPRATLSFDVAPRFAGSSRYDLWRLGKVAVAALWSARNGARSPVGAIAETVGRGL